MKMTNLYVRKNILYHGVFSKCKDTTKLHVLRRKKEIHHSEINVWFDTLAPI